MVKAVIQILFLVILVSPQLYSHDPINDTLERRMDVTGNGVDERVSLTLKAKSIRDPMMWILKIKSHGKVIFTLVSDDAWLDKNFKDPGFVNDACSYEACKKQYYYHDFLDRLFVFLDSEKDSGVFDPEFAGSIHHTALNELTMKHRIPENSARAIIAKVIRRMEKKQIPVLFLPVSPVQYRYPMVYIREVGAFVTIYFW